jgi:Fur family iron response transcriptional regulator
MMMIADAPDRTDAVKLLRQRGIIPTHQRLVIAHVLFARQQHLSAEQLLAMVNQTHAEVSKATIYNTLNLFAEKGLVREVIVDPTRVYYDTRVDAHHHFFDMDSCMLTDIESSAMHVNEVPALPEGMMQEGVNIVVRIRRNPAHTAVNA